MTGSKSWINTTSSMFVAVLFIALLFHKGGAYREPFQGFSTATSGEPIQHTLGLHSTSKALEQKRRRLRRSNSSEYYQLMRQWRQYESSRHLSRYEVQYRQRLGVNVPRQWDGQYDSRFEDLFHVNETIHRRHLQETSVNGGKFDNYQAIPLSQGYGTHFAIVWVGSPMPARKTVIVDTGSHYTAFPCTGCKNCGAPHHTDPYFSPQRSQTFHQLLCHECQDGVVCEHGKCKFNQAYTEGSSWEAVQVRDRFYCGGPDVIDSAEPRDQKYAIDFMFGCQTSMTGLFITQLADGIMGCSAHPATFPKKLFDAGKIEHNMFAMCYRRELGTSKRGVTAGSMTLGGVSNNLDTSPMVYAKNMAKMGWFTVYVKNIYVRTTGGQSANSIDPEHRTIKVRVDPKVLNTGKGCIVDSGTTDTYLNKKVSKEFTRAWKTATGQVYSHTPMSLTPEQLRSLPTILIQCQAYSKDPDPSVQDYDSIPGYAGRLDPSSPKDLLIAIPATSYMDYSPITKKYMSRLYFTESNGGVLGSNTMQGHNVLFDWQNGRVGFAESSCAYDKKDIPKVADDAGFATDCEISNPVLTTPCVDTLDPRMRRMCRHNPTNIALLGNETWTAIVNSPGNDAGVLCTEAARRDGFDKRDFVYGEPVVTCSGEGVCEEKRPCQLTCEQLAAASNTNRTDEMISLRKDASCGDSGWSACDYGCMQTRISSRLFSDGTCRQVSRQRRKCHIGACARSDPCRVPYIVHTVLAFRGGSVLKWTEASKDLLAEAIVRASGNFTSNELFSVADIHVVVALPWYKDQDEIDSLYESSQNKERDYSEQFNAVKLGVKVVIEISMYNPLADAANRTNHDEDFQDSVEPGEGFTSVLQNLPDRIRGRKPKVVCRNEELFAVAKRALEVKEILRHDKFMENLVDTIKETTGLQQRIVFGATNLQLPDDYGSRILSVWTIRTGIEAMDEINYFGPQKPISAVFIAFLRNMLVLSVGFFTAMALWNFLLTSFENATGQRIRRKRRRSRHRSTMRSESTDNPFDIEDTIIRGTGEVEIPPQPGFKLTSAQIMRRRVDGGLDD